MMKALALVLVLFTQGTMALAADFHPHPHPGPGPGPGGQDHMVVQATCDGGGNLYIGLYDRWGNQRDSTMYALQFNSTCRQERDRVAYNGNKGRFPILVGFCDQDANLIELRFSPYGIQQVNSTYIGRNSKCNKAANEFNSQFGS